MVSKSNERLGTSAAARGRFRLHAVRQLTDLGGGRFESTGTAPRFDIRAERHGLPAGWVRIRFSIADARPYASGTIRVTPEGDQPTISHPLPSLRDGHVDQYIRLPDSVRELCFDPMDQPGVFTLTGFRIDPITRFHVLARAALRNPGKVAAAAGYVARHGVAAAKLRMAERLNAPAHDGYKDWVALFDTLADDDVAAIRAHIAAMKAPPLISVVMPVYDPDPSHLAEAIGSVIGRRSIPHWELCIADDASTDPASLAACSPAMPQRDRGSRLVRRASNGHISRRHQLRAGPRDRRVRGADGPRRPAAGPSPLSRSRPIWRPAIRRRPHLLATRTRSTATGGATSRISRPDWNPELLLAQNMISHLGVYRPQPGRRRSAASAKGSRAARTTIWPCASAERTERRPASATSRGCSTTGASRRHVGSFSDRAMAPLRRTPAGGRWPSTWSARARPREVVARQRRLVNRVRRALPDLPPLVSRDRADPRPGRTPAQLRRRACCTGPTIPTSKLADRRQRQRRAARPWRCSTACAAEPRVRILRRRGRSTSRRSTTSGRRRRAARSLLASQQRHRGDRAGLAGRDGQPRRPSRRRRRRRQASVRATERSSTPA